MIYKGIFSEDEISVEKIIQEHKEEIWKIEKEIQDLRSLYIQESLVTEEEDKKQGLPSEGEDPNNRISINQKKWAELSNGLMISEESYKKMNKIMQNCCSTVSRIMYQLEPNNVID